MKLYRANFVMVMPTGQRRPAAIDPLCGTCATDALFRLHRMVGENGAHVSEGAILTEILDTRNDATPAFPIEIQRDHFAMGKHGVTFDMLHDDEKADIDKEIAAESAKIPDEPEHLSLGMASMAHMAGANEPHTILGQGEYRKEFRA